MSLFQTSVHTLRARTRKLEADIDVWSKRASKAGDLPLHTSQMKRLRMQISSALEVLIKDGPLVKDATIPEDGDLAAITKMRRGVGSVHLIWDFFRDKLAQRDVASSARHLRIADDLAWACYQPFLEAASAARDNDIAPELLKEPPMVFYDIDRTPFAQARTKALQPAGLESKDWLQFSSVLQRLPVPVIGIPWSITNRLPELVLVGHETGHIVAEDLGLGEESRQVLNRVSYVDDDDNKRREAWQAWCDEVWADVFGVLATGRAYVDGLAAELVGEKGKVQRATIDLDDPGHYPTPTLRIALCEHVLTKLGVEPSSAWGANYGILVDPSRAFEGDIKLVVSALLDRKWNALGRLKLEHVFSWTPEQQKDVELVSGTSETKSPATPAFDVRVWIAAAMDASMRVPKTYEGNELDDWLAEVIDGRRTDTMRSTPGDVRAASTPDFSFAIGPGLSPEERHDEEQRLLDAADAAAGVQLAGLLEGLDLI